MRTPSEAHIPTRPSTCPANQELHRRLPRVLIGKSSIQKKAWLGIFNQNMLFAWPVSDSEYCHVSGKLVLTEICSLLIFSFQMIINRVLKLTNDFTFTTHIPQSDLHWPAFHLKLPTSPFSSSSVFSPSWVLEYEMDGEWKILQSPAGIRN